MYIYNVSVFVTRKNAKMTTPFWEKGGILHLSYLLNELDDPISLLYDHISNLGSLSKLSTITTNELFQPGCMQG